MEDVVYHMKRDEIDKMVDDAHISIGKIPESWPPDDDQPFCFWAGNLSFDQDVCIGASSLESARDAVTSTAIEVLERVLERLKSGTMRVEVDYEEYDD